jgi:colanic acid/amylovoran biosynthesis glycosyltransferase
LGVRVFFFVECFPKLSETFILDQIVGLLETGYDVRIVADRRGGIKEYQPGVAKYHLMERMVAPPESTRLGQVLAALWFVVTHPRFTRGYRFASRYHLYCLLILPFLSRIEMHDDDVVVANFGPNGIKAAQMLRLGRKFRLITIFHGADVSSFLKSEPAGVYSDVFRCSEAVLPISELWADRLVALGCPGEKIVVYHMGIDLDVFRPDVRPPDEAFVVLSIGRLVAKKGFQFSIRAFKAALPSLGSGAVYRIVGDGPLMMDLQQLARDLELGDRLQLLGSRTSSNVKELLQEASVLVVPSVIGEDGDMEGIPVSMLEAQAMAIPVIASRHSGLPEGMRNGVTGVLTSEGAVGEIAAALADLYSRPLVRRRLGESGRAFVEQEFNIVRQTKVLAGLIERAPA